MYYYFEAWFQGRSTYRKNSGKIPRGLPFGALGVGKTRLCNDYLAGQQAEGVFVLKYDLLHNETYQRLLKRPHFFRIEVGAQIQRTKSLIFFVDEVQKVPALLDEVHSLYETHRGKVHLFIGRDSARGAGAAD